MQKEGVILSLEMIFCVKTHEIQMQFCQFKTNQMATSLTLLKLH